MSTAQDRDLPIMIGRDVRPGRQGQHGEGFADVGGVSPDAGDAEPRLVLLREQPLVLALLFLVLRIGELVDAVGNDQAAARRELAPVRPEIVDRPLVLSRPAPAALNEIACFSIALDRADDRRGVGDLDVVPRLNVRGALGEADLDFDVGEVVGDCPGADMEAIVVALIASPARCAL